MKIDSIEFDRTPQVGGWRCRVWFRVTTARQFTDERHMAEGHGRYRWLALWRAKGNMRAFCELVRPLPGERAAKGWG